MKYKSIGINLVYPTEDVILIILKISPGDTYHLSNNRYDSHRSEYIDFHNKVSPSF
jgi:hypothetical protein